MIRSNTSMLMEKLAGRVMEEVSPDWGLRIKEYCVCLRAAYVVVEDKNGERSIGISHIALEDLHDSTPPRPPSIEDVDELVMDLNPITRSLALSLLNAVSQYIIKKRSIDLGENRRDFISLIRGEPVCVIGNMVPLVRELEKKGVEVYVFEKNPRLRCFGKCFSDSEERILLPRCRTLIITGMTLLNHSIDGIIAASRGYNIVVGPTAGILPMAFRSSGVDIVGSVHVVDIDGLINHLRLGNYLSGPMMRSYGKPYLYDVDNDVFL